MEIYNKRYKRIGTEDDIIVPKYSEGEFVVLSNGGRIKMTTLMTDFEPIGDLTTNVIPPSESNLDADSFFGKELLDNKNVDKTISLPPLPNNTKSEQSNQTYEEKTMTRKDSRDLDAKNINSFANRLTEDNNPTQTSVP